MGQAMTHCSAAFQGGDIGFLIRAAALLVGGWLSFKVGNMKLPILISLEKGPWKCS